MTGSPPCIPLPNSSLTSSASSPCAHLFDTIFLRVPLPFFLPLRFGAHEPEVFFTDSKLVAPTSLPIGYAFELTRLPWCFLWPLAFLMFPCLAFPMKRSARRPRAALLLSGEDASSFASSAVDLPCLAAASFSAPGCYTTSPLGFPNRWPFFFFLLFFFGMIPPNKNGPDFYVGAAACFPSRSGWDREGTLLTAVYTAIESRCH